MGQDFPDQIRKKFVRLLRSDLNHLYDPGHLKRSYLIDVFGLQRRFDAPYTLQKALMEAIDALRFPAASTGSAQNATAYKLLYQRYILQSSQAELATQLGMSVRQLRREQTFALELLAAQLWNTLELADRAKVFSALGEEEEDREESSVDGSAPGEIPPDVGWLLSGSGPGFTNLNETLEEIIELVQPLLEAKGVDLEVNVEGLIPLLEINPVVLKQALLNLITAAIRISTGDEVQLELCPSGKTYQIEVHTTVMPEDYIERIIPERDVFSLTHKLVNATAARLTLQDGDGFSAVLSVPVSNQVSVLVVDDNPDFFQLMQRFVEGTHYQIIGLRNPEDLIEQVEILRPALIVLDVMIPNLDGWELLRRLKGSPAAQEIPVLISTILPQRELALALGASGFLQKPLTKEGFLDALSRLASASQG